MWNGGVNLRIEQIRFFAISSACANVKGNAEPPFLVKLKQFFEDAASDFDTLYARQHGATM